MVQQHRIILTLVNATSKDLEPYVRSMFDELVSKIKTENTAHGVEMSIELKRWDNESASRGWKTTRTYPPAEVEAKAVKK